MIQRVFVTIGLLLLLPLTCRAVMISSLYEVEVPVADTREESHPEAIRTAMSMVLVKLTGDRYAPGRSALAPVLDKPRDYVQQLGYREPSGTPSDPAAPVLHALTLWVRFDEELLNRTLRELGVPVWGRERPTTLLWLAAEDGNGRALISLDSGSEYIGAVDRRAALRGIVLIFPLLDLEDSARLRASDIWGGFQQPVLDASARYPADSVLTGRIVSPAPGIWEGRWTAYLGGEIMTWVTEGDLPDLVLDEGIDGMADLLASRFASSSLAGELDSVSVTVADVFTVDEYAAVLGYLQSLNSVTEVQVERVEQGKVIFRLTAHGGGLAVAQAIALGRRLQPIGSFSGHVYRLLP